MAEQEIQVEAARILSAPQVGAGLVQTRSSFQTAVQVLHERDLTRVLARCLEEASIAGEDFYYSWKQGDEVIEGLSAGAALSVARNFGNCAVEVQRVEDIGAAHIFYGAFIDLETGFNLVRPFRQNKQSPKSKKGKEIYSGDRGQDVMFQIGASKAIRNVVLNAAPKWLTEKVLERAKENVIEQIKKLGPEKVKARIASKANSLGIDMKRVESAYGAERSWGNETFVQIMSALKQVEDGMEKDIDLFPLTEDEAAKKNIVAESAKKVEQNAPKQGAEEKPKPEPQNTEQQPEPKAKTDAEMSEQEKVDLLLSTIHELDSMEAVKGFKKRFNEMIGSLSALKSDVVVNTLSAKEAELSHSGGHKDMYTEFSTIIGTAKTKKDLAGLIKRITGSENEGKINAAQREQLIDVLNTKLSELS